MKRFDRTLFVGHGKICVYELLHTAGDERRNELSTPADKTSLLI